MGGTKPSIKSVASDAADAACAAVESGDAAQASASASAVDSAGSVGVAALDERLEQLEHAERAIEDAYSTGKAERAKITQLAQLDAAEAVAMVGIAMESDAAADEAVRIAVIAEGSRDASRVREARKRERAARKKARTDHRAATKAAKRAYDAVKFSAPNKMGFMRFVQVVFAVHIAIVLISLTLTSRDTVVYSSTNVFDWVMIVLEGVAFWLFINRYKIARPFVIAMALLEIVVTCGIDAAMGTFNAFFAIGNSLFSVFLVLYFAFSRRARSVLVNDLSKRTGEYERGALAINRRGWPFVRNLVIYFVVFSVLGHWMEMGLCQFIIMGFVQGDYDPSNTMLWRDWLYPFPMEGAAVVLIALLLYPFKEWLVKKIKLPVVPYIVSFAANALLCSVIEFSMGLAVNADYQLWDYRDNFCNFMGQVCLQNTLAFGVAASVIAWFIYPMLEKWIARVPRDIMNIVFVVVLVFGGIIWSLYVIEPPEGSQSNMGYVAKDENPEEDERDSLAIMVAAQESFADNLQTELDESKHLTDSQRAQLQEQLDAVRASLARMYEVIEADPDDVGEVATAYAVVSPAD